VAKVAAAGKIVALGSSPDAADHGSRLSAWPNQQALSIPIKAASGDDKDVTPPAGFLE